VFDLLLGNRDFGIEVDFFVMRLKAFQNDFRKPLLKLLVELQREIVNGLGLHIVQGNGLALHSGQQRITLVGKRFCV
jgi:hypothetical protein